MSAKQRPYKKLYCDWRRTLFVELRGARLAVWLYHYLRSNKEDESWPSISLIARETGLNRETVIYARQHLFSTGWLLKAEDAKFKTRRVVATFPQSASDDKKVGNSDCTSGQSENLDTRKPDHEVDTGFEVSSGYDTSSSQAKHDACIPSRSNPCKAAASALKLFSRTMGEEDAFKLVLWIIYRAAHPEDITKAPQIPKSVAYYKKSWANFDRQYEDYGQDSLFNLSWDRFDTYARNFVASNEPKLLEWLEATWAQLDTARQPLAASAAA